MTRRLLLWLGFGLPLLLLGAPTLRADDEPPQGQPAPTEEAQPSLTRLRAECEWLTAVERMGRLAWAHREASAAHIAKAFGAAGLAPLPGREDLLDDHAAPDPRFGKIRNVVGWLPGTQAGSSSAKPGPYVILSAHYDHLGFRSVKTTDGDTGVTTETLLVAHGADDNASGVAALIEIARLLAAEAKRRPLAQSVMFVAFDLEEQQDLGSHAFVDAPPLALAACRAFVTMDQLGRSLADVTPGSLFLMGTENCAELGTVLAALPAPRGGTKLVLGIDFQPGYSDYVPFQEKKIPYVFVTSGACRDYHRTTDTVDKLEWPHLVARTQFCKGLVAALAGTDRVFAWHDERRYDPDEMKTLRGAIAKVQAHVASLGLPEMAAALLKNYAGYLDKILEDGKVTEGERTNARNVALTLFRMATQAQQAKK